jgi:BirA family transcriptional regulator, biotin operon repressor / biotin---[acetyl-CoA-carboxylase] ligase
MTVDAAEGLRSRLLQRGLAWPAPIHAFDLIDSTNNYLKALARTGADPWTVILARRQSAGRGRHGHTWLSPAGGLYLSVLLALPPRVDHKRAGALALLAGVAVARALGEYGVEARLKWPNDVRVRGRKIAGILAEAVSYGGAPLIVLGVGVNVDWDESRIAEEMRAATTSVRMETRASVDAPGVGAATLAQLTLCYDSVAQRGAVDIVEQWGRLCEPWWGREVVVSVGDQRFRGTAVGVDEDGALLIDRGREGRCALHAGDVTELRPERDEDEDDGR